MGPTKWAYKVITGDKSEVEEEINKITTQYASATVVKFTEVSTSRLIHFYVLVQYNYNEKKKAEQKSTEVLQFSKEESDSLYRIFAGLSSDFSSTEVYPKAKTGMSDVYTRVIKYGKDNKVDSRGGDL